MPDLTFLTFPLLGAAGVMLLAFLTADDIAIDTVRVPPALAESGYSDVVITQLLSDHIRAANEAARGHELGLRLGDDRFDVSIGQFEQYLGLAALVTGLRELTGAVPYYVNAEVTEESGKLTFTARIFVESGGEPVYVVSSQGDIATIEAMLEAGALRILERIKPYIVALHYHEQELVAGNYTFDETVANLEKFILSIPPDDNYLAFDLVGRMHLERAKCDPLLTEPERAAERNKAGRWLQVALDQVPDYHLAHQHMAELHVQSGDYKVADRHFALAVQSDPDFWPTRERWGEALVKQGRVREAIFQYVAAVELHPNDVRLRMTLGDLYRRAGRPDAAVEQLRKAVELNPDAVDPDLRFAPSPTVPTYCRL